MQVLVLHVQAAPYYVVVELLGAFEQLVLASGAGVDEGELEQCREDEQHARRVPDVNRLQIGHAHRVAARRRQLCGHRVVSCVVIVSATWRSAVWSSSGQLCGHRQHDVVVSCVVIVSATWWSAVWSSSGQLCGHRQCDVVVSCVVIEWSVSCVVIVSTVVTPSAMRAGSESLLIQKPTHDSITISIDGTYVWRMKKPT